MFPVAVAATPAISYGHPRHHHHCTFSPSTFRPTARPTAFPTARPTARLTTTTVRGYSFQADHLEAVESKHWRVAFTKEGEAKPTLSAITNWALHMLRNLQYFEGKTDAEIQASIYRVWYDNLPRFGVYIPGKFAYQLHLFGVPVQEKSVRQLLLSRAEANKDGLKILPEANRRLKIWPEANRDGLKVYQVTDDFDANRYDVDGVNFRAFYLQAMMGATKNFDNASLLGESSYGKLYKGRLYYGTEVAIRCLPLSKKYTIPTVECRLEYYFAKLRHPHLACLLGYCLDDSIPGKVYLVSEYVPNGTFRDHLSGNSPGKVLNWSERLAILIGVAEAVRFLHSGSFFCNRLKTNNILLNEHGMAKLSDFGLSILAEEVDKSKAKDDLTSRQMISLEEDAYNFGYILLEALVGSSMPARREALLQTNMASLNSQDGWKQIVEPAVLATCSQESLSIVISIMKKCICPDWSCPSFKDILWNLQLAAQVGSKGNL